MYKLQVNDVICDNAILSCENWVKSFLVKTYTGILNLHQWQSVGRKSRNHREFEPETFIQIVTFKNSKLWQFCIHFVKPSHKFISYQFFSGNCQYPELGTTNLHLDISDAVNVMVYVAIPKTDPESEVTSEDLEQRKLSASYQYCLPFRECDTWWLQAHAWFSHLLATLWRCTKCIVNILTVIQTTVSSELGTWQ